MNNDLIALYMPQNWAQRSHPAMSFERALLKELRRERKARRLCASVSAAFASVLMAGAGWAYSQNNQGVLTGTTLGLIAPLGIAALTLQGRRRLKNNITCAEAFITTHGPSGTTLAQLLPQQPERFSPTHSLVVGTAHSRAADFQALPYLNAGTSLFAGGLALSAAGLPYAVGIPLAAAAFAGGIKSMYAFMKAPNHVWPDVIGKTLLEEAAANAPKATEAASANIAIARAQVSKATKPQY